MTVVTLEWLVLGRALPSRTAVPKHLTVVGLVVSHPPEGTIGVPMPLAASPLRKTVKASILNRLRAEEEAASIPPASSRDLPAIAGAAGETR